MHPHTCTHRDAYRHTCPHVHTRMHPPHAHEHPKQVPHTGVLLLLCRRVSAVGQLRLLKPLRGGLSSPTLEEHGFGEGVASRFCRGLFPISTGSPAPAPPPPDSPLGPVAARAASTRARGPACRIASPALGPALHWCPFLDCPAPSVTLDTLPTPALPVVPEPVGPWPLCAPTQPLPRHACHQDPWRRQASW